MDYCDHGYRDRVGMDEEVYLIDIQLWIIKINKMEQSNSRVTNGLDASHSQQLATSIISEMEDPKNSRVLNRKQIQKRLQNLKPAEYEKVIYNLNSQNRVLQEQVRNLHAKVEQLMISKKMPNPHNRNPLMQEEVKKAKKELALKYESMNYLKEELRKSKQSELTDDMKHKIKEQKNQTVNLELEIEKLKKEKEGLTLELEANQEALEEYAPRTESQDERMNSLREENKNIKQKVQQLNEKFKITQKNSQEALQKFYNLKQEEQKFIKALLDSKNSKKKLTLTDIKAINVTEVGQLEKQVDELKKQKKQAEKQLVNQKIIKDQRKAKIEKEARDNIEAHKELLKKRMKVLNQLNLYEAKDRKQRDMIEAKVQEKEQVHCEERGCQTDKIIPIDFRKEWIGNSEGLAFDDSLILDYRSHVFIKSFIIYKTADYISFIKFFYENSQKKRYESKIPFDPSILRKLESKKYVAKGAAFLKSFKVALTSDRVTKVEFIWSDGEVAVEGWQTDGSTKFNSDVDPQERPISMFGTLSFQGKNAYALESLGCEINKNEPDE